MKATLIIAWPNFSSLWKVWQNIYTYKTWLDWEQLAHPHPDSMQMYSLGHSDTFLNEINCNQRLLSPCTRTKAIKVTYSRATSVKQLPCKWDANRKLVNLASRHYQPALGGNYMQMVCKWPDLGPLPEPTAPSSRGICGLQVGVSKEVQVPLSVLVQLERYADNSWSVTSYKKVLPSTNVTLISH